MEHLVPREVHCLPLEHVSGVEFSRFLVNEEVPEDAEAIKRGNFEGVAEVDILFFLRILGLPWRAKTFRSLLWALAGVLGAAWKLLKRLAGSWFGGWLEIVLGVGWNLCLDWSEAV